MEMDELKKASGGVIVEVNGSYWAFSDGPDEYGVCSMFNTGFKDKNRAIARAEEIGWSTEVMTLDEYRKKYGLDDVDDPTTWRPVV